MKQKMPGAAVGVGLRSDCVLRALVLLFVSAMNASTATVTCASCTNTMAPILDECHLRYLVVIAVVISEAVDAGGGTAAAAAAGVMVVASTSTARNLLQENVAGGAGLACHGAKRTPITLGALMATAGDPVGPVSVASWCARRSLQMTVADNCPNEQIGTFCGPGKNWTSAFMLSWQRLGLYSPSLSAFVIRQLCLTGWRLRSCRRPGWRSPRQGLCGPLINHPAPGLVIMSLHSSRRRSSCCLWPCFRNGVAAFFALRRFRLRLDLRLPRQAVPVLPWLPLSPRPPCVPRAACAGLWCDDASVWRLPDASCLTPQQVRRPHQRILVFLQRTPPELRDRGLRHERLASLLPSTGEKGESCRPCFCATL